MAVNAIATINGNPRYVFATEPHTTGFRETQREVSTVITMDGRHHTIPADQAIEWLPETRNDIPRPTLPTMVYRVTEAYKVRSSEQTACNYREFEIQPGDYPVVFVNGQNIPVTDDHAASYARIVCDAIETESYFVSTAFGRTLGVDHTYPMAKTTRTLMPYPYDVDPAKSARYVEIVPASGEVFPESHRIS